MPVSVWYWYTDQLKRAILVKIAGFELTYDSGNTIQPSQKIMIKHNTVPYSETEKQNFLFAAVKNMINPLQLFIFTNVIPCSRLTL